MDPSNPTAGSNPQIPLVRVALADSPFRVVLDDYAQESEVAAVAAACAAAKIEVDFQGAAFEARSRDQTAWLVLIGAPAALFAKAFLEAAGRDAWETLKTFCQAVYAARRQSKRDGGVVIRGDHWIVVGPDLPDEAYRDFLRLDFERASYAFAYDLESGRWVNAGKQAMPFVDGNPMNAPEGDATA